MQRMSRRRCLKQMQSSPSRKALQLSLAAKADSLRVPRPLLRLPVRVMAAARLRHAVRFERRANSPDEYGNELGDWQPRISAIWAEVKPLRGTEEVLAAKLQGRAAYEVL